MASSNADTVRKLLKLFENMDVPAVLPYFTDDAIYRFGNYPAAVGKAQIEQAATSSHMDAIKSATFEVRDMLEFGDTVVCEMDINYTKVDGSILVLPCTDLFEFRSGLISSMKIFMDATPLFAHSGAA